MIADSNANKVRRVDPQGVISTIVGTGDPGHTGDGGAASSAEITEPHGVNFDGSGNLYVSGAGLWTSVPAIGGASG
ncbi:MAG: hypothetical protein U0Y82_09675 [Thermoleophilia bacterium]